VSAHPETVRARQNGDGMRSRILDAAERMFAERGYAAATTREIASEAEINKRMLFYYYPTKDALYRAVLERVIANLIAIHERFRNDPGPVGIGEAAEGSSRSPPRISARSRSAPRDHRRRAPSRRARARLPRTALRARRRQVDRNVDAGAFRAGDPMPRSSTSAG
jgi:AcrR family transcriptional regulator